MWHSAPSWSPGTASQTPGVLQSPHGLARTAEGEARDLRPPGAKADARHRWLLGGARRLEGPRATGGRREGSREKIGPRAGRAVGGPARRQRHGAGRWGAAGGTGVRPRRSDRRGDHGVARFSRENDQSTLAAEYLDWLDGATTSLQRDVTSGRRQEASDVGLAVAIAGATVLADALDRAFAPRCPCGRGSSRPPAPAGPTGESGGGDRVWAAAPPVAAPPVGAAELAAAAEVVVAGAAAAAADLPRSGLAWSRWDLRSSSAGPRTGRKETAPGSARSIPTGFARRRPGRAGGKSGPR